MVNNVLRTDYQEPNTSVQNLKPIGTVENTINENFDILIKLYSSVK